MDTTTPSQWYLGINDEAVGPLDDSQVKGFFESGQANGKTQAWVTGMENWVDADTIEALQAILFPTKRKTGPPTLPISGTVDSPSAAPSSAPSAEPSKPATQEILDSSDLMRPVATEKKSAAAGDQKLREGMTFEEIVTALGLTMKQVEAIAASAIDLAGQTKSTLKLGPPQRWGLFLPRA